MPVVEAGRVFFVGVLGRRSAAKFGCRSGRLRLHKVVTSEENNGCQD